MKLTIAEIQGTKYVQIYLTEEELQKKETKDLVKKYKQEKYSVAIFVSGKENYPEILEKIITKQVWLNREMYANMKTSNIRRDLEDKMTVVRIL